MYDSLILIHSLHVQRRSNNSNIQPASKVHIPPEEFRVPVSGELLSLTGASVTVTLLALTTSVTLRERRASLGGSGMRCFRMWGFRIMV